MMATGLNLHREDDPIRQARMALWASWESTPILDQILEFGFWKVELGSLTAAQLRKRMDSLGVKGSRKSKAEMIAALTDYWCDRLNPKKREN